LEGARQGAERMLWKVGEVLREVRGQCYSGYRSEESEESEESKESKESKESEESEESEKSKESKESEGVDGMTLRLRIKNQFTFLSVGDKSNIIHTITAKEGKT